MALTRNDCAWAVEQGERRSLQFFDEAGNAVHKVYCTAATELAAYRDLVERYATAPSWPELKPYPPSTAAAHAEDPAALRAAWLAMQDTHEFFPLLQKFAVTRLAALQAAGADLAQQVAVRAAESVLQAVAASGLPIMCFVGNRGMIQIHTGPVHELRRTGPWFNVLDPNFNLHLNTEAIASAWVVNKPTRDGWVTSLETYAASGDLILQFFGEPRVVTLGGSVTEIIYALGEGDRLVGNDLSSLYPEAATRLPRVGYYRAVPVEGVAALKPDLVLASEQAGPPQAIEKLAALGIPTVTVSDTPSVASLDARIRAVARALGREAAGEQLVAKIHRELDEAIGVPGKPLRAVTMLNRTGIPQGAGSHTAADAIMEMAGLVNVLHDVQKGYKPLSNEGLAALAPELLLIPRSSLQASGGMDQLRLMLGLSSPTRAQRCRVVVVEDMLILGVGPRLPQVLRLLKNEALRGVGG
eukprot:scaffold53.g4523.t1